MAWTLRSFCTTAGYLHVCPINFPPGLSCIIGARGTCKSTIVETIRFVFDCDSKKVQPMLSPAPAGPGGIILPRAGLIAATLGGGTGQCTVSSNDGSFAIERNIQGPPRVFRDGVQQIDGSDVIRRVEIFSQGDLQEIAADPERRMALIDRPNQRRVDDLRVERDLAAKALQELGPQVRRRRAEIEAREALVKGYDAYERELHQLQAARPKLPPEMEVEQKSYLDRRQMYERLRNALQSRKRAVEAARALLAELNTLQDAIDLTASLHIAHAEELRIGFMAALDSAKSAASLAQFNDSDITLKEALDGVAEEFERRSARFYELRKEQQEANVSLKKEEALRAELDKMDTVRRELELLRTEHESDLGKRTDLRTKLDQIADELYDLRSVQVEQINKEFGEQVVLTLHQGMAGVAHIEQVKMLLKNSNLRGQAEVARDLAVKIRPADLIDIVESGDAKRLVDLLQRDLGQMTRLVSHLLDADGLYTLEASIPDDALEITMFVRGESRPIGQLSGGQMATALLPLILRDAEYPLIVDQPEDDLDNAFVSDKLIRENSRA